MGQQLNLEPLSEEERGHVQQELQEAVGAWLHAKAEKAEVDRELNKTIKVMLERVQAAQRRLQEDDELQRALSHGSEARSRT